MKLPFYKYHGTGNDFIMIDNRHPVGDVFTTRFIASLCHRRFGVGADGLILLENDAENDFKMVYYNSDGNQSTMCGNGGRAIVAFAHDLGIIKGNTKFLAIDGVHTADVLPDAVALKMQDVNAVLEDNGNYILNTGSPHYVAFFNNIDSLDVYEKARTIRFSPAFSSEGINVNFVQAMGLNEIKVRTYERGVEDETYSCGTGVVASAIAHYIHKKTTHTMHKVSVVTPGGRLEVTFTSAGAFLFEDIILKGAAQRVFEGVVEV